MNSPAMTVTADDVSASPAVKTLSICLINPRFEPSYWGFEFALPLYPGDKRSTRISGSLSSVAGLCGAHNVTWLDENVEDFDCDSMSQYDMAGVMGMNVQKNRIREILVKLCAMPSLTRLRRHHVADLRRHWFRGNALRGLFTHCAQLRHVFDGAVLSPGGNRRRFSGNAVLNR
jgi:hypothetical protein